MIFEILTYISFALLVAYIFSFLYVQRQRSGLRTAALLQEKAAQKILSEVKKSTTCNRKELQELIKNITVVDIYQLKKLGVSSPPLFLDALITTMIKK
ncbi:MAG: hypothetical protein JW795_07975, partial [Chitinivibrionales bacterium]|nr:hypothetical protein [Chitinivibrionales bacterium]